MSEIDYKALGPAVQDGKIKYLSVSSVSKFDPDTMGGCPRRWYYHYIEGDKEEGTKAQALGTQVHAEIAHYLTTGQDLLGNVARPVKPLLPEPGGNLYVELGIAEQNGSELTSALHAAGVPFVGNIDLFYIKDGVAHIIDHKTTSRYPKDLPGADEVANSIQMTGYGVVGLTGPIMPPSKVFLAHNYIGTKKRYAEQVGKIEDRRDVLPRWTFKMDPLVERMKSVAGETNPENIEKNTDSCHAWHRTCKYVTKCFADPIEQLLVINKPKEKDMGLNILDALKAPAAPPAPAPAKVTPSGLQLPPPGGQGVNGPFYTVQQQDLYGIDADGNPRKKLNIEVQSVLPPDAPKSDPAKAALPPPEGETLPAGVAEKAAALEPAPKKRGRPPKAKPVESVTQPVKPEATVSGIPDVEADKPSDNSAAAPGVTTGGVIIAVDCIAPGVQSLNAYVNAIVDRLAESAKVLDVRTIRDRESPLAFGGWRGVMAALAKKDPPAAGVYAIASSEFADAVLEGLEAKATIIRGRR